MNDLSQYQDFVYSYSDYLSGIKHRLDEKYSLWLLTERYEQIKDLRFIRVVRTNYFSQSSYDMWFAETEDRYYYIRYASGLVLMAESERYIKLPYTPFERLGIFVPPSKDFMLGFENFKQLADIIGWRTEPDAEESWA